MLHLGKRNNPFPCFISPTIANQLKYHQIQGLRFLYKNFINVCKKNDQGIILNDAEGLGKRVTIAALLHAFITNSSKIISSVLILCMSKSQSEKWMYILHTFAGLETISVSDFEKLKKGIVIECIKSSHFELNCNSSFKDFNCVILEVTDSINWNMLKKIMCPVRTRKKIIVTDTKLRDDLLKLWSCISCIDPELAGDQSYFLQKFEHKDFKYEMILSARLRNILLRRELNDIDYKDFPIVDEKVTEMEYKAWKKNKHSN
ncbi:DNA repair protein rhp54-like [Ctenocephalides felis]|uniref:DNA repair protein rhp54-like n=1 Tax=Ctenocephalides felis TaxID=7515 RepID=UPI000E6E4BE8|nr:DNA repair protein rhp54-like [Ctenocephalides felis]